MPMNLFFPRLMTYFNFHFEILEFSIQRTDDTLKGIADCNLQFAYDGDRDQNNFSFLGF
jgi:hypothetical protein